MRLWTYFELWVQEIIAAAIKCFQIYEVLIKNLLARKANGFPLSREFCAAKFVPSYGNYENT